MDKKMYTILKKIGEYEGISVSGLAVAFKVNYLDIINSVVRYCNIGYINFLPGIKSSSPTTPTNKGNLSLDDKLFLTDLGKEKMSEYISTRNKDIFQITMNTLTFVVAAITLILSIIEKFT